MMTGPVVKIVVLLPICVSLPFYGGYCSFVEIFVAYIYRRHLHKKEIDKKNKKVADIFFRMRIIKDLSSICLAHNQKPLYSMRIIKE